MSGWVLESRRQFKNDDFFRQGLEMELLVGIDVSDGFGTMHIVSWCGCIVQKSHPIIASLGFFPEQGHGVYVSR